MVGGKCHVVPHQYLDIYLTIYPLSSCPEWRNKATGAATSTFIYVVSLSHLAGPHVTNSYVTYIFLLYYIPPSSLLPPPRPCPQCGHRQSQSSLLLPASRHHSSFAPKPTHVPPCASKHRRKAESVSQFAQICVRVRLCVWSSPYGGTSKG